MSDDADRVARLEAILAGFNAHDLDAIMEHFTDDCVFEAPRGPHAHGNRLVGRDAVRGGFAARFDGIPDVRYESRGDFVGGDRGVSEWTISGTTRDGDRIEVRGCDIWTFAEDGRVSVKNSFWKLREAA